MNQSELNTALINASEVGDLATVQVLLQTMSTWDFSERADVHAEDDKALRLAATNGHTEIVQTLLQAGANVSANRYEALRYASSRGHDKIVQILLQADPNIHPNSKSFSLYLAACQGHDKIVRMLLQVGADVHDNNDSSLRYSALYGRTETVQILLQAGADVHANVPASNDGALYNAATNGRAETVLTLLQAGADLRALNAGDLSWIVENSIIFSDRNLSGGRNYTKTIHILLQAGVNPALLSLQDLKKVLTPKFILSLPDAIIARIETSHQEAKEKYNWSEKRFLLKSLSKENSFDSKISLADFYYRPGAPGYYQAIV